MKEIRKHFTKLGLMFFLGSVIIYGLQFGIINLVQIFKPEWLMNGDISLMVSLIPMYLIGMPIMILLVKTVPAVKLEKHSMKVWQFLLALLMTFCIIYSSNIVGTIISTIVGFIKGSAVNNVVMQITSGTSIITMIVYMVICAPIMEEVIFRKLIVDRTVRYGQGVSVLLSGLMFGLFHGNLNQFVYAFALGMFLAFIYVKTGKIKYTIIIHMIVNFVGSVLATVIMDSMNYQGYMEALASGSQEAMMEVIMGALPGWIAYFGLVMFMGISIIAGIVLFILFRKRFTLVKGEVEIPKEKVFVTTVLNVGMILFSIFWIVLIIMQLLE